MRDSNKKNYAVQICSIILFVFFSFLLGKGINAEILKFQDDFENCTIDASVGGCGTWITTTLAGGTWLGLRVRNSGNPTKEAVWDIPITDRAGAVYTSTTTTGNVKFCFDFKHNKGFGYWRVNTGTTILLNILFADYDADNFADIRYSTSTGMTNLIFDLNSGYWVNVCLNVDITNHLGQVCLGDDCSKGYQLFNNYQGTAPPNNFIISGYSQARTDRTARYDNVKIYTGADITYEQGVEIIKLPDWGGEVQIGSLEDISAVNYTKCIIGETCLLWFDYGFGSIGSDAHLVLDVEGQRSPEFAIQTRGLISGTILRDYFYIPAEYIATIKNYCIYLDKDEPAIDKIYCDLKVEWVVDNFDIDLDYDVNSACDSVASSSGSFWDDFRYGVECGFRKVIYWGINPTIQSQKTFFNNANKLKTAFPFNVAYTFTDTILQSIASSTIKNDNTFDLPFINKLDNGQAGDFYMIPILSSSSMSDLIGAENTNFYRKTISWLLWGATAFGAIILII